MIRALFIFLVFLLITQPCHAIREGTATADIFIKHCTRSGDFGKLALWHAAAAECLKRISVPMNEIAYDYYKRRGYKQWVARAEKEAHEIQEQYKYHRKQAKIAWQKSETPEPVLNAERENIQKFIATWLPRYPDRFYEFGIYPTFFSKQREIAVLEGNYVKALHLEADAAELCATQYEKIPIAYGLEGYQKHRDAYRQHALQLRYLAQQAPKKLPAVVNRAKQFARTLQTQTVRDQPKEDIIRHIARSDARVKTALGPQSGVNIYATFQGFAWIVRFANHSRGNLVTAIIDEKTAEVLDVF